MALTAEDVCYCYASGTGFEQRALHGVTLSIGRGSLVLVVGATGSGKSTLLRLFGGLLTPESGSLLLDDEPLLPSTARGVVGLVFQDAESQLFADTVLDDVAFGPRNLGFSADETAAAVESSLRAVGLDSAAYGHRSPFSLSGGEARRAAIAGVLAMRPSYLLLDEPTAGLDARGRALVRAAVDSARQDAGVVVVSHSAEEFLGEADHVVVLDGGTVSFSGSAANVLDDPSVLDRAGLRAPDVLRVQQRAREQGIDVGPFTLDPALAAASLARAGGWRT